VAARQGDGLLNWLHGALVTVAALLCVPVAVLCIECVAALLPVRRRQAAAPSANARRPRLAVLVPAHNESTVIRPTLTAILSQLSSGDRLVVVADNCDDDTPDLARAAGAEVVVRHDPVNRGKGFAMDAGVKHLAGDPPDVVVILDADCALADGALDALRHDVSATGRPAQGVYLLDRGPNPDAKQAVSSLAFLVKNWVRPAGLSRLGMPCLLTGSGMAFPWETIRSTHLATDSVVEDMELGLRLAASGHAPVLCTTARITGPAAPTKLAARTQRQRWEHGHVRTLVRHAAPLAAKAVVGRKLRLGQRVQLAAMALELAVPPLALLGLFVFGTFAISVAVGVATGHWAAAVISGAAIVATLVCLLTAATVYARGVVPMRCLVGVPGYVLSKFPIYWALVFNPQRRWVRTARHADEPVTSNDDNSPTTANAPAPRPTPPPEPAFTPPPKPTQTERAVVSAHPE